MGDIVLQVLVAQPALINRPAVYLIEFLYLPPVHPLQYAGIPGVYNADMGLVVDRPDGIKGLLGQMLGLVNDEKPVRIRQFGKELLHHVGGGTI